VEIALSPASNSGPLHVKDIPIKAAASRTLAGEAFLLSDMTGIC
jgi:hypothetical protein